jgi:hypothetical protein
MGSAGHAALDRATEIDALREAVFLLQKASEPRGPSTLANRSLDREGWDEIESALFLTF